ncbi:MAG: hybrid sensor histidine kinase/response regulator [Syntrophales bacterium]
MPNTTKIKSTLLVVDDEVSNVDTVIEALGESYTVRVATDGESALESVKKAPPDLIILDVMMPGLDGFEVCRRLKADPTTQEIPVIFLTALHETMDKTKGFSAGGVDYVTKPFHFADIHARVEAHLELHRRKCKLQQSYDKLRELETLRDSLVHMIVHDMRSPLSLILGNLELVEMETVPKEAADCINRALSSTKALLQMVSTLLDISKMEAGEITLDVSAVDIKELASETIRMVEPVKGRRKLTLTSPKAIGEIQGDADLIRRLLQNLIGNALKFTNKETGTIAVRIESAEEEKVRVSVVDNGPGIPLEYRDKVFDKFCQVAARKQGQVHSTGLGLTFCKLAVEAHGGRIGLESKLGKGSTFWFELPRRLR